MPKFNATDPNAYPAANWAPFDAIVRDCGRGRNHRRSHRSPAVRPSWAEATVRQGFRCATPRSSAWKPNAAAYGQFVQAMGTRYSGHVHAQGRHVDARASSFWASVQRAQLRRGPRPQAINDSTVLTAPMYYRRPRQPGLQRAQDDRATAATRSSSASSPPQGFEPGRRPKQHRGLPGNFGQTRPQLFLRELYCVDNQLQAAARQHGQGRRLPHDRGGAAGTSAARTPACSTPAACRSPLRPDAVAGQQGRRQARLHPLPGHPAGRGADRPRQPRCTARTSTSRSTTTSTATSPTRRTQAGRSHYVSPATAAIYINWAEYLSWKQPADRQLHAVPAARPAPDRGPVRGLRQRPVLLNGKPKADLDAYRLPVYMPSTTFSSTANGRGLGRGPASAFMQTRHQPARSRSDPVPAQRHRRVEDARDDHRTGGYFDVHVRSSRAAATCGSATPIRRPIRSCRSAYPGATVVSRTQQDHSCRSSTPCGARRSGILKDDGARLARS